MLQHVKGHAFSCEALQLCSYPHWATPLVPPPAPALIKWAAKQLLGESEPSVPVFDHNYPNGARKAAGLAQVGPKLI